MKNLGNEKCRGMNKEEKKKLNEKKERLWLYIQVGGNNSLHKNVNKSRK